MKSNLTKWAIQKSGRLTEKSLDLINKVYGTQINIESFKGYEYYENEALIFAIFLVRDDDIPFLVSDGYCDVGVCSEVVKEESLYTNFLSHKLNFLLCNLVYATQENVLDDDKKIVTKFPNLAKKIFGEKFEIVKLHGGSELASSLGISARLLELTSSGESLRKNKYTVVEVIREYDTEILVNSSKKNLYEDIILKI